MALSISEVVLLLEQEYGSPVGWWSAETPFEVAVGAILTQRTSWANVESSIDALRREGLLTPSRLVDAGGAKVEMLVRRTGFYRQKSKYLLELASYVQNEYSGDLLNMSCRPQYQLREELLKLRGIGPETADSILLYALSMPSFVVDAYTTRFLARLGLDIGQGYDAIKHSFESAFENDPDRLSKAHALIVIHCKSRCRTTPDCSDCPLLGSCRLEAEQKE